MIGLLALTVAALYSGAALYVNLVERPALLALYPQDALAGWQVALKRGALIQPPLVTIGFLLGLAAWIETHSAGYMIGALLMLVGIPWTIVAILPINKSLMRATPEAAGAASSALLQDWYTRHAVRTALGLLALIAFLVALL
jgi:hypothetical protein